MPNKFSLNIANHVRDTITAEQAKQVQKLYEGCLKTVRKSLIQLKGQQGATASLQRAQLNALQKALTRNLKDTEAQLTAMIQGNMKLVSNAVIQDNVKFLEKVGIKNLKTAFASVPDDVVKNIATGKVYEGDWTLSKALWSNTKKAQDDIQAVIAKGVAQNKSSYAIAQELEKYVNPAAAKDWAWNKVYPGTSARIDYNAQRLSRTMTSHAYSQSTIMACRPNPFVSGIKWYSSDSSRTCDICAARNGNIYSVDDVPMDHPNGLCTLEPYLSKSFEDIASQIGDWINGNDDPELDKFARYLHTNK